MSVTDSTTTPSKDSSPAKPGDESSVSEDSGDGLEIAGAWMQVQATRVQTAVELSLAETRLAASSLQAMLFLAVVTAVLTLTAWGVFVAGLVIALGNTALPLWASLFGVAVLHGAIALLLYRKILKLGENLSLPVTRRHLFGTENTGAGQ